MSMVSFREDGIWFNHRAAGIVTRPHPTTGQIEVLVTTEKHLPYCYLPGGRVSMGEDAQSALAREMKEELGRAVMIQRLLFVVENFHPWNDGQGTYGHEVGLYFEVVFPDAMDIYESREPFDGCDNELDLTFFWKSPAEVSERPLVPAFLREVLSRPLPSHPVHIVHRERDGATENIG